MERTCTTLLANTGGGTEGVENSSLRFPSGILRGRWIEHRLGLAVADSLKVVGLTAVGACFAIGRAVVPSCLSGGIFAVTIFPQ